MVTSTVPPYVDQNGDNKIDEEDLIAYKKSAPDVYMGLSNQISYKNWDLSFAVRASFGNYVYNNVQSNREAWDGSQMYDQSGLHLPETLQRQAECKSVFHCAESVCHHEVQRT